MNFSHALLKLKEGWPCMRDGWNGKNMYVALSPGFQLGPDYVYSPAVKHELNMTMEDGNFLPYLMMRTADGAFVPWVASHTDMLSDDWHVLGAVPDLEHPPVPWRPGVAPGQTLDDLPLSEWIGQAVGSASMCWIGGTGDAEFDSVVAAQIAESLHAHVQHVIDQVIAGTTKAVK